MTINGWSMARFALIASLSVTGYLLLMQWPEFQRSFQSSTHSLEYANKMGRELPHNSIGVEVPELTTPAASLEPGNTAGDVPTVYSQDQLPDQGGFNGSTRGQIISVQTDVLNIEINTLGGDVVMGSLPTYPVSLEEANQPTPLLSEKSPVYVAQSGIIGQTGFDLNLPQRPVFSSPNKTYQLEFGASELTVPMTLTLDDGILVTKRFHFFRDSYLIKVSYEITNQGVDPWLGYLFGQLKRDSSPDQGVAFSGFALPTYLGTAYWTEEKAYNKLGFDDIADEAESGRLALDQRVTGGWLSIIQHYFLTAWIPPKDEVNHYTARQNKEGHNLIGFTTPGFYVQPGQTVTRSAELYIGPKLQSRLESAAEGLELAIDYGMLFFISNILMTTLSFIHEHVGNWGLAIILLTCLVKLCFYYPSAMSYRSMAKMRKVQPKMTRLKEMYGDDKQRFSQEMLKLYQKEKINPVGGCLPMLLQMPVFLALYWTLMESVELRQAPFLGWVQDLSVMDPYFVLPLLMGVSMFVQMKLNPTPPDPMQAKVMQFMPIIFTVLFLFFPSGLVLYWLTNNVLSIAQQWWITRAIENAA